MSESGDYILLKWGTLKGWSLRDPSNQLALAILNRYGDLGMSRSAMQLLDTEEQKMLLCQAVDEFSGQISSDWSGETYTKESAKEYIMNYGRKSA